MAVETLFPTLGEFTKALFDLSGVMPTKGDDEAIFSETEKKSLQKLLIRLSREEGDLIDNYDKAKSSLYKVLEDICPSKTVFLCCLEIISELEVTYKFIVKSEASHLSKKDTIKWLLKSSFVKRLVLSIYKNIQKFNVQLLTIKCPDHECWFLPGMGNGGRTPLAKYLSWLYSEFDTTQTHFHYPRKNNKDTPCHIKKLNLDNASKWINGKRLPSWASLQQNLVYSFKELQECKTAKYKCEVNPHRVNDLLFIAFLARLSTKVCQTICDAYGEDFLQQLVEQFKRYRKLLQPHVDDMQIITAQAADQYLSDLQYFNRECISQIDTYWKNVADDSMRIAAELQQFQNQSLVVGYEFNPEDIKNNLLVKYSEFLVLSLMDSMNIKVEFSDTAKELIGSLYQLLNNKNLTQCEIDGFQKKLNDTDYEKRFLWVLFWLKAKEAYRRDDFKTAFDHYEQAFTNGKYLCGSYQDKLINEYLLLAAKNNQWLSFKKGVSWACFLSIEIRWLRDLSPSEDDVRSTFELFKMLNYIV